MVANKNQSSVHKENKIIMKIIIRIMKMIIVSNIKSRREGMVGSFA
jgi:hypothetical protein